MGIPRFFGWVARRQSSQGLFSSSVPDKVDSFYFDLNALLYQVYHRVRNSEDEWSRHSATTVEEMEAYLIDRILETIRDLVRWVAPRKRVYLAIDGVPPRAKMEQQRMRRYKVLWSDPVDKAFQKATEMESATGPSFDPAQWTPGTVFFERFEERVQEWVKSGQAMRGIPREQEVEFTYSGAYHPGEGEHKIMMDILQRGQQSDTVVIYGLDADLLLLCMRAWIQVPNIYLMREDANSQAARMESPVLSCPNQPMQFFWIAIRSFVASFLREVRNAGQEVLRKGIAQDENDTRVHGTPRIVNPDQWSAESCIADAIFLYSLLGNDFLPGQTSLDIGENGLENLWQTYADARLRTGLTCIRFHENGAKWSLDERFLFMFFRRAGSAEIHRLKYLQNQRRTKSQSKSFSHYLWDTMNRQSKHQKSYTKNDLEIRWSNVWGNEYLRSCFEWTDWNHPNAVEQYHMHHFNWKQDHETVHAVHHTVQKKNELMEIRSFVTSTVGQRVCRDYMKTLAFVFQYYWYENPDMKWYYPHHSIPMMNDFCEFIRMTNYLNVTNRMLVPYGPEIWWRNFQLHTLENGKPAPPVCRPLEQLFYVLPPSKWDLVYPGLYADWKKLATGDKRETPMQFELHGTDQYSLMHVHPKLPYYRWQEWMDWLHSHVPEDNTRMKFQPIRRYRIK